MSNNHFQFKQFTIHHERCAMKVGTDGVLLGAWVPLPDEGCVLDVGTGTGLIALMVAQRAKDVHVLGIDIDEASVTQAVENVQASPFADRVEIRCQSLQQLAQDETQAHAFNAIVCNPPFFEDALLPPDRQRSQARHTTTLPFDTLVHCARQLLCPSGTFSVIIPTASFDDFRRLCFVEGLYLKASINVQTTANKAPKRVMVSFADNAQQPTSDTLILTEEGARSEDYRRLTRDFYLY